MTGEFKMSEDTFLEAGATLGYQNSNEWDYSELGFSVGGGIEKKIASNLAFYSKATMDLFLYEQELEIRDAQDAIIIESGDETYIDTIIGLGAKTIFNDSFLIDSSINFRTMIFNDSDFQTNNRDDLYLQFDAKFKLDKFKSNNRI